MQHVQEQCLYISEAFGVGAVTLSVCVARNKTALTSSSSSSHYWTNFQTIKTIMKLKNIICI